MFPWTGPSGHITINARGVPIQNCLCLSVVVTPNSRHKPANDTGSWQKSPTAGANCSEWCPETDSRDDCSVRSRSAGGRIATVGVKDLPRHVAGILAGEEQEARRHLVRLPRPSHRRVLAEFRNLLRRLPARGVQRSPDRTRRHAVHANSFFDEVLRKRPGETEYGP